MFSGIVETCAAVVAINRTADGARLVLDLEGLAELPAVSDSVAVQGVCLTATEMNGSRAAFDMVHETLRRTTLGDLRPGSRVNVELSLRVGDRVGGHFVLGHVDGIAKLERVNRGKDAMEITIRPPENLVRYIAEKGSVTLDGISLTVAGLGAGTFSVAIVPYTAQETTIGETRVGAGINLEIDVLARYCERLLGK